MQPSGLSPSGNSRGGPPAAGRPAPHTAIHPHRHTPVAHLPPLSPLTALLHGAAPGSIREGALRHDRPPPPLMLPISQVRAIKGAFLLISPHTFFAKRAVRPRSIR